MGFVVTEKRSKEIMIKLGPGYWASPAQKGKVYVVPLPGAVITPIDSKHEPSDINVTEKKH